MAKRLLFLKGFVAGVFLPAGFLVGVMLVLACDIDSHRSLQPASRSMGFHLLTGASFLALLWCAAWLTFRRGAAPLNHAKVDLIDGLPAAMMPLSLIAVLWGLFFWINMRWDTTRADHDLIVTDVYTLERNRHSETYVVAEVPARFGGSQTWSVNAGVPLDDLVIGSRFRVTCHEGYLGEPWCDYHDAVFEWGPLSRPVERSTRGGQVSSAQGWFIAGSAVRQRISSWGIPVTDLDGPVRGRAPR